MIDLIVVIDSKKDYQAVESIKRKVPIPYCLILDERKPEDRKLAVQIKEVCKAWSNPLVLLRMGDEKRIKEHVFMTTRYTNGLAEAYLKIRDFIENNLPKYARSESKETDIDRLIAAKSTSPRYRV